jgi:hypothetical protein
MLMSNEKSYFFTIIAITVTYDFFIFSLFLFKTFSFKIKENILNCDLVKSFILS